MVHWFWWRKRRRPAADVPPLADGTRTVDGAPAPAYWLGLRTPEQLRNERPAWDGPTEQWPNAAPLSTYGQQSLYGHDWPGWWT